MEILDEEIELSEASPQEDEWRLFIGNNADYFIPIWQKFKTQDKRIHFNLMAMLFNIYWFGYRKMYKIAAALIIGSLVALGFILVGIGTNSIFEINKIAPWLFVYYLIYFGLAFMGDWLYYDHAQKTIQSIKQKTPNKAARQKAIQEAGGTNMLFPFLLMGLLTGLSIVAVSLISFIS